jgi:glycerophosphoryl diester phosphodiesterase
MLHISHRGGSRENLENTLEAFEFAREYTDMLECDVFISKDKQVVVYHDNNMMRMNGVNKGLEEYNYDELPAFVD